jgi:hypothetical protein
MNARRGLRSSIVLATLLIVPTLALAEVSVQLDSRGNFKRFWYLTAPAGRRDFVWRQVRPYLPQNVLLNPIGDTLGDKAPVIQVSPATGYPWVVWPKNIGNIRQLAFSTWDGKGKKWTDPTLINPDTPLLYDETDPSLAIGADGTMYLVWARLEQTPRIYFSTFVGGRWTPAFLISDPEVESRAPSIVLNGSKASISFKTPDGQVTRTFESGYLIESGMGLMDNPIPPLGLPPGTPDSGSPDPGTTLGHTTKPSQI